MPVAVNERVYNTSISLKRVFVSEFGYDLVLRLKILRKRGLSRFGIFEKQDSSQVKPRRVVAS